MKKPLLAAVLGQQQKRPPVWIMRQAGRYLPEYRELRKRAGSFLDLCYNPKLAAEVSLQPLKRFDLDGAILFSDILVVPDALGQKVDFIQGDGPVLNPLDTGSISALCVDNVLTDLEPVFETIERIKAQLEAEKTLIGFCGSPWTVATYMIGGRGSPDQAKARLFALEEPAAFESLINILIEASIKYLIAQIKAGADVVQLFESWALNLDEKCFQSYVIGPNTKIVEGVRSEIPDAAIIGFPRGAAGMLKNYAQATGVNMLGVDYSTPVSFADSALPVGLGVQGNLDPLRLVIGGQQMTERIEEIIKGFSGRPHIFNLGHGIVPQTPVSHVADMVAAVKGG